MKEERREKTREDEREKGRQDEEKMKGRMKEKMKRREKKEKMLFFFSKKCFKTLNPPDELTENVSKKNPRRTNYSSIFLYKFRILPFFSFMYMIRIRFFGPGELIQNGLGTEQ